MGAVLGASYGSTSSKSTGNSTQSNTYTPGQSDLQDSLAQAFKTILPGVAGGGITPNVAAVQTQNADTINKSYSGLTDRVTKFLASRGFGSSGETAKVGLQGELGRQSALAGNNTAAAGMQLDQNSGWLQKALEFAFNQVGASGSGSSTGNSSGWGISGGVGGGTMPKIG